MFIVFFYILLLASFIFQNFNFDQVYYQNVIFIITISVITVIFNYKKLKIPKYPLIFFIIYLVFTLISLISNIDNILFSKNNSFLQYGLQISLFLFFIIGNSLKDDIKKYFTNYIYIISVISVIFYAFSKYFSHIYFPKNYYQMYYFSNKNHNHIGDLVVLPIIISYWYLTKDRLREIIFIAFFYFFCIFSYSRSAYLSLIMGLMLMLTQLKFRSNQKYWIFLMCFVMLVFSFVLVGDKGNFLTKSYKKIARNLTTKLNTNSKELFSDREKFLNTALYGIKNRPLLGAGINNFIAISKKYQADISINANIKPRYTITTSHNMLIDILCESGAFAFIFYLLFLGYVLINSHKNLYFVLAISMLMNFMFDYTFEIPPFILIFYLLLGVVYREKLND